MILEMMLLNNNEVGITNIMYVSKIPWKCQSIISKFLTYVFKKNNFGPLDF